jgi:hypothetical protein
MERGCHCAVVLKLEIPLLRGLCLNAVLDGDCVSVALRWQDDVFSFAVRYCMWTAGVQSAYVTASSVHTSGTRVYAHFCRRNTKWRRHDRIRIAYWPRFRLQTSTQPTDGRSCTAMIIVLPSRILGGKLEE